MQKYFSKKIAIVALSLVASAASALPIDFNKLQSVTGLLHMSANELETPLGQIICAKGNSENKCWIADKAADQAHLFEEVKPAQDLSQFQEVNFQYKSICDVVNFRVYCRTAKLEKYGAEDVPLDLSAPSQVVVGWYHACAIDQNRVRCWGRDVEGQSSVPANIENPRRLLALPRGTCAVHELGVSCWGFYTNLPGDVVLPLPASLNLPNLGQVKEIYRLKREFFAPGDSANLKDGICLWAEAGIGCLEFASNTFVKLELPGVIDAKIQVVSTAYLNLWNPQKLCVKASGQISCFGTRWQVNAGLPSVQVSPLKMDLPSQISAGQVQRIFAMSSAVEGASAFNTACLQYDGQMGSQIYCWAH